LRLNIEARAKAQI
jgi:hypothetical protein